jgi:hypothetical protein
MSEADPVLSTTEPGAADDRCQLQRAISRGGGPCTLEGKASSRANSIKHGMTATALLPEILQPGRVDFFRRQFEQEIQPRTMLESVVVDELSRHAARLEFSEQAEGAVLRKGAETISQMLPTCDGGAEVNDASLCGAVGSKTLDQLTRYRAGHEKGFFRALHAIRELGASQNRRPCDDAKAPGVGLHFGDEIACEEFLRKRFDLEFWRCPRCGLAAGHWLPSRRCWECSKCRLQSGLRLATVMHGSPIALVKWFSAIELLLTDPGISVAEVGRRTRITRKATVRRVVKKIRCAIASRDAPRLLAGLDAYFGCRRST